MKMKFCPKCLSTDVRKSINEMVAMGVPSPWICTKCELYSDIFPEAEKKEINKIRKSLIKNHTRKS